MLTCFSLCLTLIMPLLQPAAFILQSWYLLFLSPSHLSVFWQVGDRIIYLRERFCDSNCGCSRSQSRSILCSRHRKDYISFSYPFPANTLAVSIGTLFFPLGDLEGSSPVQWTSSGTSFLPAKSSAAPRGGLRSAVRLGSCGGVLGQQTSPWCVGRVTAQWMRHLSQPIFQWVWLQACHIDPREPDSLAVAQRMMLFPTGHQ